MPRPRKCRRVCELPLHTEFGPRSAAGERLAMAVDEYECIRLIDLEGLTQEEAAAQMQISRSTVQAIYNSARHKLALCLVAGRELVIGGGDYEVCPRQRPCGSCRRDCPRHSRENDI